MAELSFLGKEQRRPLVLISDRWWLSPNPILTPEIRTGERVNG
jgi:hypothetical protein